MIAGIYIIRNIKTNKAYIGSSKDIENRFYIHKSSLKNNKHINIYLQRAYNKYGLNNFVFELMIDCDGYSSKELLKLEQYILDSYKEELYNLSRNAGGGDNITYHPNKKNIIKKISSSLKKKYRLKDEKEKLSKRSSGENNPMFDKNHKKDSKIKISKKLKEFYKNNDSYKKGKTFEELYGKTKAKKLKKILSNFASKRVGKNNSFFGKNHSDEVKKVISEKNKGRVNRSQCVCVIIDDVEYYSLSEASRKLKIPTATILWRIRSKNKKFENYKYKEYDDKLFI